jgi:hypothetical protein
MSWYRLVAVVAGVTLALLTVAGSALAGGWAVTTIDALPEGGFVAGRIYRLGYTIRQHGQHPFAGAKTAITIVAPGSRDRHVFPGITDGPVGHYVAEVTFPFEGAWDWEVSQEPFAVQTLGTIAVAPPVSDARASGAPEPRATFSPASALSSPAVPLAALLLTGLIAWPLVGLVRRRRAGSARPLARAR